MSILGMNKREYNFMVDSIAESFALIGQDAHLYQVASNTKDFYHDNNLVHRPYVNVGCVFEDNPKPILKKFNWLTEDDEMPYLCYLVAKDKDNNFVSVEENMLITIPSVLGLETQRTFQIVNVRGNSIDPLYWICKLAPYRPKVDLIPATEEYDERVTPATDVGFTYLNR